MQPQDRSRYFQVMAAMASAFRVEADEVMLEGYWMGLAGLTLAQFERGAVKAMRTAKFMPTVAELRECAGVNLQLEQRLDEWSARDKRIYRGMTERRERDRIALENRSRSPLPKYADVMRGLCRLPGPPAVVDATPVIAERAFDEKYAQSVKSKVARLKEQEERNGGHNQEVT